jgi:hypothetical protein
MQQEEITFRAHNMHTFRYLLLGVFDYKSTTTYYAIANQSPLYHAVFSQIEYP